jgi:hypothetical protein
MTPTFAEVAAVDKDGIDIHLEQLEGTEGTP